MKPLASSLLAALLVIASAASLAEPTLDLGTDTSGTMQINPSVDDPTPPTTPTPDSDKDKS